jgi:hypothetical protein
VIISNYPGNVVVIFPEKSIAMCRYTPGSKKESRERSSYLREVGRKYLNEKCLVVRIAQLPPPVGEQKKERKYATAASAEMLLFSGLRQAEEPTECASQ